MLSISTARQLTKRGIHLKCITNGMPLCPQDFTISAQLFLAKNAGDFLPRSFVIFSKPRLGQKKIFNSDLKPTNLLVPTHLAYLILQIHQACRKLRFRRHMSTLRGQWQLLCSHKRTADSLVVRNRWLTSAEYRRFDLTQKMSPILNSHVLIFRNAQKQTP